MHACRVSHALFDTPVRRDAVTAWHSQLNVKFVQMIDCLILFAHSAIKILSKLPVLFLLEEVLEIEKIYMLKEFVLLYSTQISPF